MDKRVRTWSHNYSIIQSSLLPGKPSVPCPLLLRIYSLLHTLSDGDGVGSCRLWVSHLSVWDRPPPSEIPWFSGSEKGLWIQTAWFKVYSCFFTARDLSPVTDRTSDIAWGGNLEIPTLQLSFPNCKMAAKVVAMTRGCCEDELDQPESFIQHHAGC